MANKVFGKDVRAERGLGRNLGQCLAHSIEGKLRPGEQGEGHGELSQNLDFHLHPWFDDQYCFFKNSEYKSSQINCVPEDEFLNNV